MEVDPDARVARARAGATWGQFDAATQAHGLAVTAGNFGIVTTSAYRLHQIGPIVYGGLI